MAEADLFVGGRVFTGQRYCDAMLVEDGVVTVAGTRAEAQRAAPTGTQPHDLHGSLLIPGLIDAHLHVAALTRSREGLDLTGVGSVEAMVDVVRQWAESHPSGGVVGRGWDAERFAGGAWPTRLDIDRAVAARRAILGHVSGHAAVVNSATLAAAGVDRTTPDPPGGRFGRDEDGSPDGRVFESAIDYVENRIGRIEVPSPDALCRTLNAAAGLGLTTIGAMSTEPEEAIALRALARSDGLPGRVRVYLRGDRWEEYFRTDPGPAGRPGRFAVVGVKAYSDGAFGTRTAWLSEPYADDPGRSGMPVAVDAELRALLRRAQERGLTPAVHAIGDRAIGYVLDLLEQCRSPGGLAARIEHAALTPPSLFPALLRVRPVLVVQPGFVWSDHWLGARLGAERARWAYAFRSLTDQGLLLAGSSDAPYDPVDPWRGLQAAVHRTDPTGRSANPSVAESLTPPEAIRLYSANAGVALGEAALGLLETGSPADFLRVRPSTLEEAIASGATAVRETWVAGRRLELDHRTPGGKRV
jgi:predicted amidohydrolase YtcJ